MKNIKRKGTLQKSIPKELYQKNFIKKTLEEKKLYLKERYKKKSITM